MSSSSDPADDENYGVGIHTKAGSTLRDSHDVEKFNLGLVPVVVRH